MDSTTAAGEWSAGGAGGMIEGRGEEMLVYHPLHTL